MRVADYIAKRLKTLGCTDIYMVTGGAAMHLNDAFGEVFRGAVHHLHHEQSCSMAAESYARIKNKPAIVNVTAGPGAINAINGVFGAYVDSIPMIIISGQAKSETLVQNSGVEDLRQLGDQEVDIVYMIKKVCKRAVLIRNSGEIIEELDKCYEMATTGRPGPIWIDVPIDIQATNLDVTDEDINNLGKHKNNDSTKKNIENINASKIEELAYMLLTKNRPTIYVGNGIRISDSHEQLLEFLSEWPIATVTNWNSNDLLWDEHPCYSGRPGTVGNRAGNFAVQLSECVAILGARLNIRQVSYNWESFARDSWKCHVDIDKAELDKPTLNTNLKIETTLVDFFPKLSSAMKKIVMQNELSNEKIKEHWNEWIQFNKRNLEKYCPVSTALEAKNGTVNPYRLLNLYSKLLPADAITVSADGSACVIGFQAMVFKKGQRMFHNSGCASMGYELPAAIGAYHASKKTISCVAGDGSIMMNLQELTYIGEKNLPIKIILLNNKGYHSIRQTQANYFPKTPVGCGIESNLPFASFKSIAQAFKIKYFLINDENNMKEAMESALRDDRATLIEARLDLEQNFSPKLASRKLNDGSMISSNLDDMYPFLERNEFKSLQNLAKQIRQ